MLSHICHVTDKMKIFSVISAAYCFLLAVNGISIDGPEGGKVSFQCFHKWAQNNYKYFCRDPCQSEEHILAKVAPGLVVMSQRVTLWDHGDGSFTVIMSHLRTSDKGKYWCAVDRVVDTYTAVYLHVTEGLSYETTTNVQTTALTEVAGTSAYKTEDTFQSNSSQDPKTEETTTTRTLQPEREEHSRFILYLSVGVGAVLTVAIVVMALCFRKCTKKLRSQAQVCFPQRPIGSDQNQGHHDNRAGADDIKHEQGNQPTYENISSSKPRGNRTISRSDHFPSYVEPLPALPE